MANIQPINDLTGLVFTKLTVLNFNSATEKALLWNCKCECGALVIVSCINLVKNRVKSCGCYSRNLISRKRISRKRTKEHNIWANFKARCYNPNDPNFHRYGGRGIKVCDRWLESFENFFEDMGECPEGYSLDRENNDWNYEKSNCRWATHKEQCNNRSTAMVEEVDGFKMNWHEIALYLKMAYPTYKKYRNLGYTSKEIKVFLLNRNKTAIGVGSIKNKTNTIREEEINGIIMNRKQIAKYFGIGSSSLYRYLKKGLSIKEIKLLLGK